MIAFVVVVLLVVVLIARRRRRQRVLAGLDATRPAYAVAPPRRRLGNLNREQL